jgi:serine/threonine protein kinase
MVRLIDRILPSRKPPYGGYILLEEVAQGGFSRIWKARHPEKEGLFAVKILTPESSDMMDRFRAIFEADEGTIALQLEHQNVIRTFEYGREDKAHYFIVMEYVDGPNLEKMIATADRRVTDARLDLMLQLGDGLLYIHSQGLIHRDFCPKNVLYASDASVKIIDFGLTIPASVQSRSIISRAGTASYMAPEQVRNQAVDARADIYAFGLSAFELLTGRRPFPLTASRGRRMQDQLNIQPISLREVAPELPEELETVVGKCIEKDRELRYKSMADVMQDMREAVQIAQSPPERPS